MECSHAAGVRLRARSLSLGQEGDRFAKVATRNAGFLLAQLRRPGGLRRIWRDSRTGNPVFLEDYAALILGLLELYQATFESRWFVAAAAKLTDEMVDSLRRSAGRFLRHATAWCRTPADPAHGHPGQRHAVRQLPGLRGARCGWPLMTGEGPLPGTLGERCLAHRPATHAAQYPTAFGRAGRARQTSRPSRASDSSAILYPPGSDAQRTCSVQHTASITRT